MSSHHFVKEQQEPALLILDAAEIGFERLSGLLEWVPTLVVAEEAVEKVLSFGIKVDAVLTANPMDSPLQKLLESQFPAKLIEVQHTSPLEAGITYLIDSGHRSVNLVGWDHRYLLPLEPFLHLIDIVLHDGPIRYFPVKDGTLKKWLPAGSIQLHGSEDSFVEVQTPSGSHVIQIQYATFFDTAEGVHTFKGTGVFWIGEFIE